MKSILLLFFLLVLANASVNAQPTREEREGQALAEDLRASMPEENSEIRGVLKIRSRKEKITNDIPVIAKVVVNDTSWETIYETGHTPGRGAEKLVVKHSQDKPNRYFYARASSPTAALPELKELKSEEVTMGLGASDFSLGDLGLDFLHWPVQRRVKGEMRLGQACHVLESINPEGGKIQRVKSWIDKDTGGLLIAEAYDAKGNLVKEFSLSGSSFKKVNGQWQLEKMEIRNAETGSRTTLQFDLPKES